MRLYVPLTKTISMRVVLVVVSRKLLLPANYFSWNRKAEEILQCHIITSVNLKLHYLCSPRSCCWIPQYGQVWKDHTTIMKSIIADLFWLVVFGSNLIYRVYSPVLTLNMLVESRFLSTSIAFSKQDCYASIREQEQLCNKSMCP